MICWHCGGALVDLGNGEIFSEYTDPIGNKHKLHKECAKNAAYKHDYTACHDLEMGTAGGVVIRRENHGNG